MGAAPIASVPVAAGPYTTTARSPVPNTARSSFTRSSSVMSLV